MRKIRMNEEGRVKLFFSFLLLVYAGVVAVLTGNKFVFPAMLCSTAGDILLMAYRGCFFNKKEEQFLNGVTAFAMAHILYLFAMNTKKSEVCVYIAIWMFIVLMFVKFNIQIKRNVWICLPYGLCLALNAFNAWSFSNIAGIGGLLFLVSDTILSIGEKNKVEDIGLQYVIWITYVPAQAYIITAILIA